MCHYVYMLLVKNSKKNTSYIGYSKDPNKRLIEATFCNGKPTYMSGNFASKVLEKNI